MPARPLPEVLEEEKMRKRLGLLATYPLMNGRAARTAGVWRKSCFVAGVGADAIVGVLPATVGAEDDMTGLSNVKLLVLVSKFDFTKGNDVVLYLVLCLILSVRCILSWRCALA